MPAVHDHPEIRKEHLVSRKKRETPLERAAGVIRQVDPTAVALAQMLIDLLWRTGGRRPGCMV
jgi:hypothetical protein